jgi:hypothetical protein
LAGPAEEAPVACEKGRGGGRGPLLRINGGEREGRCAVCMSGVWLTDKEVEGRGDGQMEERKGEGGEGGGGAGMGSPWAGR